MSVSPRHPPGGRKEHQSTASPSVAPLQLHACLVLVQPNLHLYSHQVIWGSLCCRNLKWVERSQWTISSASGCSNVNRTNQSIITLVQAFNNT